MDKFKKIAAGSIIFLLTVLMLVLFLPGSMEDYQNVLTSSALGKYDGKTISLNDYYRAEDGCKTRYDSLRKFSPRYFDISVKNCIRGEVKETFILEGIASRLGLDASRQTIQRRIFEGVQARHNRLKSNTLEKDDLLSVDEMYLREIKYMPLEARVRDARKYMAQRALYLHFPYPASLERAENAAEKIQLDLRYLSYDDRSLLKNLDRTVRVSEKEIRAEYEKEQAKRKPKKDGKKSVSASYAQRKAILRIRLKSQKKEKALKDLKKKLADLGKKKDVNEIARLAGVSFVTRRNLSLSALKEGAGPRKGPVVKLDYPEVYMEMSKDRPGLVGPLKSGQSRVFIQILAVRKPRVAPRRTAAGKKGTNAQEERRKRLELASRFIQYLIDQEAKRGGFRLKDIKRPSGK